MKAARGWEERGGQGGGKRAAEAPGFIFLFIFAQIMKKGLPQQDRTGVRGWGWKGAPENGTQNKSEGKQRRGKMEAGGDGGACFTLIL